jgi:hypothetical protein
MGGMTAATAEKASVPMSEVRAWALKRGMSVNATGNLPTPVVEAFNRAHRSKQYTRPVRERLAHR